jgi:hypothetical protein
MERSSRLTMSSNMNILLLMASASDGSSASSPSTICRSVERSERLMMLTSGSRPPTRDISAGWSMEDRRRSSVASTALMISGEVRSMTAIRWATSACMPGASPDRSSDALSGVMCASTSAITCGCSSTMNDRSCAGSARCRKRKGVATEAALSRAMMSAARSDPRLCSRISWANPSPPWAMCSRAVIMSRNSVSTVSVSAPLIDSSRAISEETASTSTSDM